MLIGQRSSYIVLAIVYKWQTYWKTASKVKCKRAEYNKTVNICGIYSSVEEAFELCWSMLADGPNTLPKLTRRNIKLNKFAFGTPWLPDLSCKHWFTSSVWNFCCWVADSPPREMSQATKSKEKRLFSRATQHFLVACCIVRFKFLLVIRIHTYILNYWHLGDFLN